MMGRVRLHYAGGMALHTGSSGSVPHLDELRLLAFGADGALAALAATRVNIAYLTGLEPAAIEAACIAALEALRPGMPPETWLGVIDRALPDVPAPARMLIEGAAADAAWRAAPLAAAATTTNQTLFWAPDDVMLERALDYAARGFTDLKLRIGIGAWADDLRRFALLRERLPHATLSVDANGTWPVDEAPARLRSLARLGCAYVEQPLPRHEWDATAALAQGPVPIMLDESLDGPAAIDRLARTRAAPLAHLKLAKLGGTDRLMAAGRRLTEAGIGVMVGQMNEGAPSTLLAARAAIALDAPWRELYGADGLANEPATPKLRYDGGQLHCPDSPLAQALPDAVVWQRPA